MDGVFGSHVDWSALDGARVWLRLLPSGDITLVIDGGYGPSSSADAQEIALTWANELGVPVEPLTKPRIHRCECGLGFGSEGKLAEHRYTSHDGPEPAHWLAAEERAA